MRFRHVALHAADPDSLRPFYADTLGLPVVDTADGFVVGVGASALEFRRGAGDPLYHLAFTVPGGSIDVAADWLDARTDLLADDGTERFRWNFLDADAVYFADPAGNVLELLARDGREGLTDPFGADSFLDVAEVGLVTDDVLGAADALTDAYDLTPTAGSDETFSYLASDGRDGGAFVVAATGRKWYPTDSRAEPQPTTVVVEGGTETVSLVDGPVAVVG